MDTTDWTIPVLNIDDSFDEEYFDDTILVTTRSIP